MQVAERGVAAKLITATTDWEQLEGEWDLLITRAAFPSPFVTSAWLKAWWKQFAGRDRSLYIVAVFSEGRLIAVAPWCIRKITVGGLFPARCIESLGYPEAHSDYLDVVCESGAEKDAAQGLLNFLYNTHAATWDRLCLRSIPADSTFFLFFLDGIERQGKYFNLTPGPFCPVMMLPQAPEQVVEQLSPKRRKRLLQEWRLLSRECVVSHTTSKGAELVADLDRFLALYFKRWPDAKGEFGAFLSAVVGITKAPFSVEIDFLQISGVDVAAIVQLRQGTGCYGYLQAVDHDAHSKVSLGGTLLRLVMERIVGEGCTFYDFLAGSEDFKFTWTNQGRRSLALSLYQPRLLSVLTCAVRAVKDQVKLILR